MKKKFDDVVSENPAVLEQRMLKELDDGEDYSDEEIRGPSPEEEAPRPEPLTAEEMEIVYGKKEEGTPSKVEMPEIMERS